MSPRHRVPYARVTARFHDHPKRQPTAESLAADGLLARAISYVRDHETDGFVPDWWVRRQLEEVPAKTRKRILAAATSALQPHDTPLFEQVDGGGFQVHDYLEHNPSREELHQGREQNRNRQSEKRARERQGTLDWGPGVTRDVTQKSRAQVVTGGGSGVGDLPPTTEETAESPAAREVDAVLGILARCSRFTIVEPDTRIGVENAIAASGNGRNMIEAAQTAVVWASDPTWRTTSPAKVFFDALRRQELRASRQQTGPSATDASWSCPYSACEGNGMVYDEESNSTSPCQCRPQMIAARAA